MMSEMLAAETGSGEPAFRSDTTIRFAAGDKGFIERSATIPGLDEPLIYGVRAPWHAMYHTDPDEFPPRPTTNDVFIASVGACMAGTFGGMLAARRIALTSENCTVTVHGEIGAPDEGRGGHIVRSIEVVLHMTGVEEVQRAVIDRVCPLVHGECWLSQTLAGSRCAVTMSVVYAD
jgi:uncharacterized OsmC-like protein